MKWPKSEEKSEFGGRLGWGSLQLPPPQTDRLDPPMFPIAMEQAQTVTFSHHGTIRRMLSKLARIKQKYFSACSDRYRRFILDVALTALYSCSSTLQLCVV